MVKHIIFLIAASVLAVFFKSHIVHVLNWLLDMHSKIASSMNVIFASDTAGHAILEVIALLLIPVVIGLVVTVLHYLIKHTHYEHTMMVIWVAWLIILVAMLAHAGAGDLDSLSSTPNTASSSYSSAS